MIINFNEIFKNLEIMQIKKKVKKFKLMLMVISTKVCL